MAARRRAGWVGWLRWKPGHPARLRPRTSRPDQATAAKVVQSWSAPPSPPRPGPLPGGWAEGGRDDQAGGACTGQGAVRRAISVQLDRGPRGQLRAHGRAGQWPSEPASGSHEMYCRVSRFSVLVVACEGEGSCARASRHRSPDWMRNRRSVGRVPHGGPPSPGFLAASAVNRSVLGDSCSMIICSAMEQFGSSLGS
jgi:hypothetical protein